MERLKLLIVDDTIVLKKGVQHLMPNPMNLVWQNMASYFCQISLSAPTADAEAFAGGALVDETALHIVARPFYDGPGAFFRHILRLGPASAHSLKGAIAQNDVVMLRMPNLFSPLVYRWCKQQGKPLVGHIKGSWLNTVINKKNKTLFEWVFILPMAFLYERYHGWLSRRIPCLVMGEAEAQALRRYNPAVAAIEVSLMSEKTIVDRQDFDLHYPPRVLFVGRLAPSKGLENLLQAMSDPALRHWECWIVGDGPLRKNLEKQQTSLNSGKFCFWGALSMEEGLLEKYRAADIFILPSLSEGFPKVIYEACASGLPVVSSSVGAIPEKMQHGENIWLIPPGDTPAIREALLRLENDAALREKLSRNGRQFVAQRTVEATAAHFAQFILKNTVKHS